MIVARQERDGNLNSHQVKSNPKIYSRLHLIYPHVIETVKDWADCEQLTPIEVGQIFFKNLTTSIGVNCSQSAQFLTVSITHGYIKRSLLYTANFN